jgi:hypothetical protein
MQIDSLLPVLRGLTQKGVRVFLMHLDNEAGIADAVSGTDIALAPLYDMKPAKKNQ